MRNGILQTALIILVGLIQVSCGGGGGGGGGGSGPGGVAVVSSGEIESFGSIVVNGVRFETEQAEIEIENEAAGGLDDLKVGMQVQIEGELNADGITGRATAVRYEDNLEGPIASVTPSSTGLAKTIQVLGHMVRVEQGVTSFDNNDPAFTYAALGAGSVGNVVEVSGHKLDNGSILATYIQRKAPDLPSYIAAGGELEVKGVISNLNLAAGTFQIGSLVVDYSAATAVAPAPSNGMMVEVKGTAMNGTTLLADFVEPRRMGLPWDDSARAEVQGFVAELNTANRTLMLNGQRVGYSGAAFRGGREDELVAGVKIEAQGSLQGGTLNATRITFKESIRFEANVAQVDVGAGTVKLQGLEDISVYVDTSITRMDNIGQLTDLSVGNNIRLRARPSTGGAMVAVRIDLQDTDPDDRLIVQGPVSNFNSSTGAISLLDGLLIIPTSQIANNQFEIEDQVVGRAAFFAALAIGDVVKARADIGAGNALSWNQVEIEIQDERN
jgi:hypothetical protein